MSYIRKAKRAIIEISPVGSCIFKDSSELSYGIMLLASQAIANGIDHNSVVGAMEKAKCEIYRNFVVPTENQNKHDNGDI